MSGARLRLRVQARARRDEVAAVRDGVLLVRVNAPALEGRANRAVVKVIADWIGAPPSSINVIRGERSRDKVIEIDGVAQELVDEAIDRLREGT